MSQLLTPKTVISAAVVIVMLILLSLAQEMNRRWQVERKVHELNLEANQLKNGVIELSNLNQYFRTEDYLERQAREKLNYRAPGEKVVLIPENDSVLEDLPTLHEAVTKPTSIPLKWWNIFFVDQNPYNS